MKIKCPICDTEYEESSARFCRLCMYSLGTDLYLTDMLNHPSREDLEYYNRSIEEYKTLWQAKRDHDSSTRQSERVVHNYALDMVAVDGGTFTMGSNDGSEDENPLHQVTLSSFSIGKYPITQELWEGIINSNPSKDRGRRFPVANVNWYDAVEFCNKLSEMEGFHKAYYIEIDRYKFDRSPIVICDFSSSGYRLPTEAEWEYAAKGGSKSNGFSYSGGSDINFLALYKNNSSVLMPIVGQKNPNELGIYDMSGNVWEWCWDLKDNYCSSSQRDPRGPSSGSSRVARGGSLVSKANQCRVSWRNAYIPNFKDDYLGFRVARTKN